MALIRTAPAPPHVANPHRHGLGPQQSRFLLAALAACAVIVSTELVPRIPQPESYHDFADKRVIQIGRLVVPHAGDVLTNVAMFAPAVWGLVKLRDPNAARGVGGDRTAALCFFATLLATSIGSAIYHWAPTNRALLFDRLPIGPALGAVLSVIIADRLSAPAGRATLLPTALLSSASALHWLWSEERGAGDLRLYLLFTFAPVLAALLAFLRPPSHSRGGMQIIAVLVYVLAKLVEVLDRPLYALTFRTLSGHNLKHVLAGLGGAAFGEYLFERRPLPRAPGPRAAGARAPPKEE